METRAKRPPSRRCGCWHFDKPPAKGIAITSAVTFFREQKKDRCESDLFFKIETLLPNQSVEFNFLTLLDDQDINSLLVFVLLDVQRIATIFAGGEYLIKNNLT